MTSGPVTRYKHVMDIYARLQFFGPLDGIGVLLVTFAWLGVGWSIENGFGGRPSVSMLMADYRREWMRQFVTRQPRVFDASVLNSLRQGTAFFASASMIGIGGALALIGNTEQLLDVAENLSLENAPALVWEVKLILPVLFLANALLKFIWAHRLFGYATVVMAAAPNEENEQAYQRAAQAAEINITAARSFNRGIRAMYFALGALAWLLGPEVFICATLITLGVLWRREFASHSREILIQGLKK